MSFQTVFCTAGHPLLLVWESFDDIDRVYVGYLTCPVCDEDYMDHRKPKEPRIAQERKKATQLNLLEGAA